MEKHDKNKLQFWGFVFAVISVVIIISAAILPLYGVWANELSGKATLREAEWSRQVTIEEASANLEAQKLNAHAEVERAKGVAEANEIIGVSLKENEAYLRYLWISGLHDGSSEVIYIPTEANLPLLEATRNIKRN